MPIGDELRAIVRQTANKQRDETHHAAAESIDAVVHVQERNRVHLHIGKTRKLHALNQGARQLRVRNMLAPALHHAAHARFIAASPNTRLPIGIHQQHLRARLHHASEFMQSLVNVSYIFIHLRGQRHVKAGIRKRQLQHIGLVKRHLLGIGTSTRGQLQHGRRDINRIHMTSVAHGLRQCQTGEARAATNVQCVHAGLDIEQLKYLLALLHHIGCEVNFF